MSSNPQPTVLSEAIHPRLDTLLMLGANRFDPAAYHLIESLYRKAQQRAPAVQRYLQSRIELQLTQLEQRFDAARQDASTLATTIANEFPRAAETAQQHFVACDFKELKKLHAQLRQQDNAHPLAALTQAMQAQPLGEQEMLLESAEGDSLDALLKKQEKELLQALGHDTASTESSRPELKSMQLFRDTWARVSTERRVTKVVEHAPRDAGPLNSQTLVMRSLTAMREISPEYANRFVSYIDTLLWLDKSGARTETVVDKSTPGKGAPGKSASGRPAAGKVSATRAKATRKRPR